MKNMLFSTLFWDEQASSFEACLFFVIATRTGYFLSMMCEQSHSAMLNEAKHPASITNQARPFAKTLRMAPPNTIYSSGAADDNHHPSNAGSFPFR
jgi:hypothetical protein